MPFLLRMIQAARVRYRSSPTRNAVVSSSVPVECLPAAIKVGPGLIESRLDAAIQYQPQELRVPVDFDSINVALIAVTHWPEW